MAVVLVFKTDSVQEIDTLSHIGTAGYHTDFYAAFQLI